MISAKDQIIESKDKEIASWKLKNDEMAKEFGEMLKVYIKLTFFLYFISKYFVPTRILLFYFV